MQILLWCNLLIKTPLGCIPPFIKTFSKNNHLKCGILYTLKNHL